MKNKNFGGLSAKTVAKFKKAILEERARNDADETEMDDYEYFMSVAGDETLGFVKEYITDPKEVKKDY